jgi:hypothetical protein
MISMPASAVASPVAVSGCQTMLWHDSDTAREPGPSRVRHRLCLQTLNEAVTLAVAQNADGSEVGLLQGT